MQKEEEEQLRSLLGGIGARWLFSFPPGSSVCLSLPVVPKVLGFVHGQSENNKGWVENRDTARRPELVRAFKIGTVSDCTTLSPKRGH